MKNLINYYYNLIIEDYRKSNNSFYFEIDNISYEFIPYFGNIDLLYRNYSILKSNNIYCHDIITNKDNSIITIYNNKNYLLIRKNICLDKYVDMKEIISFDIPINTQENLNWKKLWEDKIDYYEYQMSQVAFRYPKLKSSFNYYVGLTESAISLLNYVNKENINYFINHKRIKYKEKLNEFLNPIDVVIDSRSRDISEYIKSNYINDNINIDDVYSIIEYSNFNNSEAILFLSRLIYPSYYFDLYDKVIQEKLGEDKIENITKKNTQYEVFLKNIYKFLKKRYLIPNIEWLN